LAQYLHDQKKLDLAGIGRFLLDLSTGANLDSQNRSKQISFEYNVSVKDDERLIEFISAETGKMKTLASSDLNSYIDLAKEFLNIGKPFQIEGVGTLVKNKTGEFEFTPLQLLTDQGNESRAKELSATSTSDESLTTYESLKPRVDKSSTQKRAFLAFLGVATAAIIIWAGYRQYKHNSPAPISEEQPAIEQVVQVQDTSNYLSHSTDTIASIKKAEETKPGSYRFVIEEANKRRAYYRYNMLKKTNVPVQISTSDSISYKLYFILPATTADIQRITDSLTIWYPAINHKRAYAEQQ
jgi:hypothetical protein